MENNILVGIDKKRILLYNIGEIKRKKDGEENEKNWYYCCTR